MEDGEIGDHNSNSMVSIEINSDDDFSDDFDPSAVDALAKTVDLSQSVPPTISKNEPRSKPHHHVNYEILGTYIYPTNLQVRDYQYNIVSRAFFHDTLVVLPTGLGKTFIASTVILNYFRWFPESKIVFMAPTKPLVAQQIKACCGITGISPSEIAILLDLSRKNRQSIWDEKKIFFTTPQVVENDLKLGTVSPKQISLLVIDEAHRAKGNYAYNNVVKFMDRFNTSYRILAMTATPASTVEGVQEIIDNLHISKAEVRTESSIDICRYLKQKQIERFHVGPSDDIKYAVEVIAAAIAPALKQANEKGIYHVTDPESINFFTAMDASRRITADPTINAGVKWSGHNLLQLLSMVGQCLRRVNIYGIRSFYSYFKDKYEEARAKAGKSKHKASTKAQFFGYPGLKDLMELCEKRMSDPGYLGHEKLEIVITEVGRFFKNTKNDDSRVIIFSEFRESALELVRAIEHQNGDLRPHIFIGQSKDSKSEEPAVKVPKKKGGRNKQLELENISGSVSSEMAQSTGMSQKMQKETIRKFKSGEYNILVATSIGEEGLDIGEVDLIVCYDSTSSPIKNVQRMGRTGRNRDGKILLLFSGNEEMKFDKAMGGYEYIQQHIRNGNMIQLHEQNRIIPDEYTPSAEKRFIEIPEENAVIKDEADDDEIIKIATKYMTGGMAKEKRKSNSKKNKKQEKIQKKFFMPDNVTTGFQMASAVKRDIDGDVLEQPAPKKPRLDVAREPDVLDLLLDSDTEGAPLNEVVSHEKSAATKAASPPVPSSQTTRKYAPSSDSIHTVPPQIEKTTNSRTVRQPQLDNLVSSPVISRATSRPASASLGTKRMPMTVIEQLKKKQAEDAKKNLSLTSSASAEITVVESGSEEFSDDDDEILALARRTQSGEWSNAEFLPKESNANIVERSESPPFDLQPSHEKRQNLEASVPEVIEISETVSKSQPKVHSEPLYDLQNHTEIISKEDWNDLYMNYYVPVDAVSLPECFVPKCPKSDTDVNFWRKKSSSFVETMKRMEDMNEQKAGDVIKAYKALASKPQPSLKDIIDFH